MQPFTYKILTENPSELDKFKSRENVLLTCNQCQKNYFKSKHSIYTALKFYNSKLNFCSEKCHHQSNVTSINFECSNCNTKLSRIVSQAKRFKNHFCSRSCSASFNNKNKNHGTRRSKLEAWLEEKLISLYPNIEFHFNKKDTIDSELDIYIPLMKVAFELNGIFHYEPIFGENKLSQTQSNDINKFQKCQELGISLCIIDTSSQKNFTEKSSQKFLDIITKIINENL